MYRKISWKTYRLLYVMIVTLTVSLLSHAQTLNRNVGGQQAAKQKTAAVGHRLSGTVTMRPDNHPVAKAGISVISRTLVAGHPLRKMTIADEQGRWTIDKLPDASYSIIILPGNALPPIGGQYGQTSELITQFVTQKIQLEIDGGDIEDIAVQVIKGGRISGTVVMNGGEPLPTNLVVLPEQVTKGDRASVRMAQVQPDGSFVLENVPVGEILLKAVVFDKSTEYFMKSATSGATDLMREPLRIRDGAEIKDVSIFFAKVNDK